MLESSRTDGSADRRALPRPRLSEDDAVLDAAILYLAALFNHLPDRPLGDRRSRVAANIFESASRMVSAMCRVLGRNAADLTDTREDPEDLLGLQERADRRRLLRDLLIQLTKRAQDDYLDAQTEAVSRTRAALRRMRNTNRTLDSADPQRRLREALMAEVEAFDPRVGK